MSICHKSCKYKPITSILLIHRGFSPTLAEHIFEHIQEGVYHPNIDWDNLAVMLLSDKDALSYKEKTIPFYKNFVVHYNNALEDHHKAFRNGRIDDFREKVQIVMDEYKIHCSEIFMRLYNAD